jgi:hypothetical protein
MATELSLDFESDPEPGRVSRLPDLPLVASVLRQSGSDRRISPNGTDYPKLGDFIPRYEVPR